MDTEFMWRLRIALEKKGITRTELSNISGVSKGDITHYLKGDYVPKQDKCYLLAKALDVDPGWLMTGYEPVNIDEIAEAIPETPEARILAKGIDKLPKEQREQALAMFRVMFAPQYADLFNKGEDDDT
ncbi:MAG: helix-turn-helix transcriptional regulator [Lachnospiraceae bacterium]|nr:helix-turn-helix transcriptional regulator [Lachnospiraceae bacterium]